MNIPVMLIYRILRLTLFQLQLWILTPVASSPISIPLPSPSLPKDPTSSTIFPSNGSFTNSNRIPAGPIFLPWPVFGYPEGSVKFDNYGDRISGHDTCLVFDSLAQDYHNHSPSELCGTLHRSYRAGDVTLVLKPGPSLTWGILARSAIVVLEFMDLYEYVGLSFDIRSATSEVYGSGYILEGL